MPSTKHLACALFAALALVTSAAEAKGPQGAGAGAMPTHSAAPNSQGIGSNSWTTQPPGWGNATGNNGWGSATTPPGWDNNTTGQTNGGWNGASPPGLDKR